MRGLILSDLHLFAARSQGLARFESLRKDLATIDLLILNGDTFDFRWSTLASQDTTVAAALDWLARLSEDLPACQIHFVFGNHDCLGSFETRLTEFASAGRRFSCHEYILRLGNALFLHGDCANAKMDAHRLGLYRHSWKAKTQKGALGTAVYVLADRLGMTKFIHDRHFPRQQTLARITHYLDNACSDWRQATRHCYFGHTHRPFSSHVHEGVCFHNTGSAIRGMEFNPLFFEMEEPPDPRHA